MEKIKLTTTLKLLKEKHACSDGMEILLNHVGDNYPEDKEINLLTILESNGVSHCLWAFRATEQDFKVVKPYLVSIACDAAESVLHLFENKYPEDKRPRLAIEAARRNKPDVAASAAAAYASASAAASASASAAAASAAAAAYAAAAYAYADADAAAANANASASAAAAAANAAAANANASAAAAAADAYAYAAERMTQKEIIKNHLTF